MIEHLALPAEPAARLHILLLGATGATGQEVLAQALRIGHRVTALARNPVAIPARENLSVIQGDARDEDALTAAMTGVNVVVSTLGRRLDTSATTLIHDATTAIVEAASRTATRRVVFLSSFGVGASQRAASPVARLLYQGPARRVYADKAAGEELLKSSMLEWTLLYPVSLTDQPATGKITATDLATLSRLPGLLPRVSRADVAAAILHATNTPEWTHKTIVLS